MVAVGRAAARDDELAHACVKAGLEDVLGAEYVDRVLDLTGAALSGIDDRREVHDRVDRVLAQQVADLGVANVAGAVHDTVDAILDRWSRTSSATMVVTPAVANSSMSWRPM